MTYQDLFGMEGPVDSGVTDVAEHGRVGNVSTGQPFKFVSSIDGTIPTQGNNPSLTLTYTANVLQTVTKTIGGVNYTKTLTYTGTDLTSVSAWVQV